jgi:hypothetical protein
MKKMLLILAAVMLFSVAGFGGLADPCGIAQTFTSLNAMGGCLSGDKFFTNFTYVGNVTDGSTIYAQFNDNGVGGSHSVTVTHDPGYWVGVHTYSYDVAVQQTTQCGGGPCSPPWGVVSSSLYATPVDNGGGGTLSASFSGGPGSLNWTYPGAAADGLIGLVNFTVTNTVNGTGTGLMLLTNQYTQGQVPEPVTMALFGSGLLALGLIRRFRRS